MIEFYKGILDNNCVTISLENHRRNEIKTGKMCTGGQVEGFDCGDEVAFWLNTNLDRPNLRLIRCRDRNSLNSNKHGKIISKQYSFNFLEC